MITFISYSSKNEKLAQSLALTLGVFGQDVRFERKRIGSHVTWHEVFDSIRACDLFVLAVSLRTLDSYSCQLEYAYANALGKRILPIVIEDIDTAILHSHFGDHYLHWRPGEEGGAALQHALSLLPAPAPAPEVPPLRPELNTPLMRLRDSAIAVPPTAPAQFSLLDNLKEFLEREETYSDALAILHVLETKFELSDIAAEELEEIFKQVEQAKRQKNPGRSGRWLRDAILIIAGAVLILVLARGLQIFRPFGEETPPVTGNPSPSALGIVPSVAVTEPASALTATPNRTLTQVVLAEQRTGTAAFNTAQALDSVTTTPTDAAPPTATETPTVTPEPPTETPTPTPVTPTITPSPSPDAERRTAVAAVATAMSLSSLTLSPSAPSLTQTQGIRNLQGTATTTVGTAIARASGTIAAPPTESVATTANPPDQTPLPTMRPFGYVGIEVEDAESGIRVIGVQSGAQQAGIRVGDVVESVDVQRVTSRDEFLEVMDAKQPFAQVTFRLRRGNTTIYIRATLGLLDFAAGSSDT